MNRTSESGFGRLTVNSVELNVSYTLRSRETKKGTSAHGYVIFADGKDESVAFENRNETILQFADGRKLRGFCTVQAHLKKSMRATFAQWPLLRRIIMRFAEASKSEGRCSAPFRLMYNIEQYWMGLFGIVRGG
jgi:hypothetical protein